MFTESLKRADASTGLIKIAIGLILLFACSQINIPLHPVPVTLQTFAVLLIGLTYTPSEAVRTVATYLVLGAMGLPVFAEFHGGIVWLFGKTGGYLFGFLFATMVMSQIQSGVRKNVLNTFLTCIVGVGIIYSCGVLWLSTFIGLKPAFQFGLAPFVLPELIKASLLTGTLISLKYFRRG